MSDRRTNVAFWIHAVCEQYATRPPNETCPVTLRISPMRPCSKLDCKSFSRRSACIHDRVSYLATVEQMSDRP